METFQRACRGGFLILPGTAMAPVSSSDKTRRYLGKRRHFGNSVGGSVTVHGAEGRDTAIHRVSPPPTPPHNVAGGVCSEVNVYRRQRCGAGGSHSPRERLPQVLCNPFGVGVSFLSRYPGCAARPRAVEFHPFRMGRLARLDLCRFQC